jgi:hypothetical protein
VHFLMKLVKHNKAVLGILILIRILNFYFRTTLKILALVWVLLLRINFNRTL